jgi:hypothetical protein
VVLLLGGHAAAAAQPALFWGDLVGATIARANLDGSGVDQRHNNAIRAHVV